MFRKHQDQFGELCYALRTGRTSHLHSIICSITPGGGKSMLPVIAATQLIGPVADRICWVVPRRSLQQQAEQEFLKPKVRELLGNRHVIRRSTNEADPCRGLSGFVTTYQAIGMGNTYLRQEFSQRRYILVLDEPHHVEEGGAWETALAPLVKRAALTVYMSGTLERGNHKRIAFLPYGWGMEGETVDLNNSPGTAAISYSRREALLERAILPIHFELMDGTAEWIGRDGATYSTRLSEAAKDTPEAIYTALKTQFAYQLLEETIGHWMVYRQTHPRSKLLVVTANIEDAKKYLDHVRKQGIKAAIATSDDSTKAAANIEDYRTVGKARSLDALVTVAMAYEGLDVPSITHIACLTHIRSKPWIEQMIARATRFDEPAGPWEEQMAFVYTPDDRNMCSIIQRMQDDQVTAIKHMAEDIDEGELPSPSRDRTPPEERNSIVPVGSSGGPRRWSRVGHFAAQSSHSGPRAPEITPSQQEAEMREKISNYCKQVDLRFFERKWGETNKRVAKTFKRPRATMTLLQLNKVMSWLEEMYPVETTNVSGK
ncbi:MAG: DEAD/DEAH box helicase family protein [Abitibacteriaceae bacterium]|nr:DEAD/DEAH box helicase family protein [Abditibacteriaceae bacterium]